MRTLALALVVSGCAAFSGTQASECSEASLGLIVAECKLKVARECASYSNENIDACQAVQECDARVDAWEKCQ